MQAKRVGSPTPLADQSRTGAGTAKGTLDVSPEKGIVTPELAITASEAQEWIRRNPHARPGVLEALAARGVLVIVPDGMHPAAAAVATLQGARV